MVFPDLESLRLAFPNADPQFVKNDFAYPAMLTLLPKGFLGLVVASLIALYFQFVHSFTGLPELTNAAQLVAGVAITTIAWVTVTLLTKPVDTRTLREFYRLVRPGGPGWKKVVRDAATDNDPLEPIDKKGWNVPMGILSMVLGCLLVYSILFATGNWIYGKYTLAIILTIMAFFSGVFLIVFWRKTVN